MIVATENEIHWYIDGVVHVLYTAFNTVHIRRLNDNLAGTRHG